MFSARHSPARSSLLRRTKSAGRTSIWRVMGSGTQRTFHRRPSLADGWWRSSGSRSPKCCPSFETAAARPPQDEVELLRRFHLTLRSRTKCGVSRGGPHALFASRNESGSIVACPALGFAPEFRGMRVKTKAAVCFEAGTTLEIETVDLEGPKFGEVLVEIKASGVCHTDEFTRSGGDPEGLFPVIFGHEGAGVVVDVGPGIISLKKGDHVIPLYTPECRSCKSCLSGKTNLCTAIRATQGQGVMPDGTSRFSLRGKNIHHYMGCSTFSNYTVLPEIALAKIRPDAPFDKVCYIGCGVTTGIGAVINTAKVEPGANVVVFGLGGIGLNVVQGARLAGANMIVGVDLNPAREALGRKFGMTHFVNPTAVKGDIVPYLVDLTKGGADYSFECIGNVATMRQALECTHRGWGVSATTGVAP